MDTKEERIRARAYQIWEEEGRPHGRHHEHWLKAAAEHGGGSAGAAGDAHPGMMGDGTEEQNLGQAGNSGARVTEADVRQAFGAGNADKGSLSGGAARR
jgi:hypothetical protein